METFITFLIVALTAGFSLYWAQILAIRLPECDRRFDRKPFNCRPCLTFHLMCATSLTCSLLLLSLSVAITGVVVAFALFLITKYIDNKKITK